MQHKMIQVALGSASALLVVGCASCYWLQEQSALHSATASLTPQFHPTIGPESSGGAISEMSIRKKANRSVGDTNGSAVDLAEAVVHRVQQQPKWAALQRGGLEGIKAKTRKIESFHCGDERIQSIPFLTYCILYVDKGRPVYFHIRGFINNGKEYIQVKKEEEITQEQTSCGMRNIHTLCAEDEWLRGTTRADVPRRYP